MTSSGMRGSSTASAHSSSLPLERELVHAQQDLRAAQEVIRLLEGDNATLKTTLAAFKREAHRDAAARTDTKAQWEAKVADLSKTVDQQREAYARLQVELQEAVAERERQSTLIGDVRRQVDGRLSKLMEELHRKEEELHKLQFLASERQRDKDQVQLLERMLAAREENVNALLSQLSTVRAENGELQAEVKHKSLVVEQLQKVQQHAEEQATRVARESSAARAAPPPPSPANALLPLYRQWSKEFSGDLTLVQDALDNLMDAATDIRVAMDGGDLAASQHDRLRLQNVRRMERERTAAQEQMLAQTSIHSDDPVAVHVHAIRHTSDRARYEMARVKENVGQLGECLQHLKDRAAQGGADITPGTAAVLATSSASGAGGAAGRAFPTSVAGAPLSPIRGASPQTSFAAATMSEIGRLNDALADRDVRLTDLQRDLFATKERAAEAESSVRILERDVQRLQREIEASRAHVQRAEEALAKERTALSAARDDFSVQLDASRRSALASQEELTRNARGAEEALRTQSRDEKDRLETRVSELSQEVVVLTQRVADLTQIESRLKSVLEESRVKRLDLKREKETLEDEMTEARAAMSAQNRELRNAQQMVESLSEELRHCQQVLDFEVQQQEREALGGGGMGGGGHAGGPVNGLPKSSFQEWRQTHQREARVAAQTVAARTPRQVVIRRKQ